ncbi:hypothetical protein Bca52824_002256 [Brassica carinata]|uniref:Uncharacterized protein n=1 Tax=Brassica carinata TaxID=52824 RepID=A0A8X7WJY9_BRACI|nr:hypothetical protein Bca52824_002256 [Brassica carinata]
MALDPEVEKLESDVREMCKKISEYRQTMLPDHLRNNTALSSSLDPKSTPGRIIFRLRNPSLSQQVLSLWFVEAEIPLLLLLGTEEQDCGQQKMIQLKETVSRNAANTHILVNRMGDFMDKLGSLNRSTIHPAFTKPRLTPLTTRSVFSLSFYM